jgi:proteasome lid subunit RPN8/RPN11
MAIRLTSGALATLIEEATRAAPQEACGLLLGTHRIEAAVPCDNVHANPLRHFEIDPAALIAAHRRARGGGPAVLGYYHSHPNGRAEPSATDRAMASGDGRIWAIVAAGAVRFWRDDPGGFVELAADTHD